MSPSEAENALVIPDDVQRSKLTFGIEDLDMDFAVMAAIKSENITDMPFGSLTGIGSMIPCMLANTVQEMEISDMSVTIGNIRAPLIGDGSDMSSLDGLVSSVSFAFFDMYEGVLLNKSHA